MKKLLCLFALITCVSACYSLSATKPSTPIAEVATVQPSAVSPEPTYTPVPPPPPAATAIVIPKYPAPGLHGPRDGSDFKPNEDILLMWDTLTPLAEDEWYEVQLWKEGKPPEVVQWVKEGTWKVERTYYPGRYQWRIRIVHGQEGKKERDLSPLSQTWSFSWLSPVPTPIAPTSPPDKEAPVDLTVYLRGTNNAPGVATFSGEKVNAGTIYNEGSTVYGDVAVWIGGTKYHFDQDPEPVGVEQLPAPYWLEVQFSDSLIAATEGIQPGSNPQKAQFWVGTLNCSSAVPKPYQIEMTLYAGEETRKHTEISFLVADAPCGGPSETERIWQPPPTYTPTPLYSPTPTPTPSCDELTVYLRGTNNAEGFAAFSGEHVDAGWIYTEGAYVYGEIAARIGGKEFHCYKETCQPHRPPPGRESGGGGPLGPYNVEFRFSDSLLAATKGVQPGFNGWSLRFWAGVLDCNSATPPDKPYRIEMTLYAGGEIRKYTEISFLVADDPLCGSEEPDECDDPCPVRE